MTGRRAIIWTAVSSEEQAAGDKTSLAHQEQLGREAAARHGLDVVQVIRSDDSRSVIRLDVAMRNGRLGYAALVAAIERRAFDVLIYYDTTRLGRNVALVATVQELCRAASVTLYDLSNPPSVLGAASGDADRIVSAIQATFAQGEVEKFRARARFGRTARARRGEFLHRIPYGYRRGEDGAITADPIAASVVLRIYREYLDGRGLPRIAEGLNTDNIPTARGSRWQAGTVAMILDNVLRYAGWMEHNRYSRKWRDPYLRTRGQWPAIIDDATAERIASERQARAANRHLADTPHLLSGVAWCMDCDHPLRINTVQSGKVNRHIYLRCDTGQHSFWQVRADQVLAYIAAEMARLTEVDIAALLAAATPAADDSAAQLAAIERECERLRRALQEADDARFVAGTLDPDRYTRTVQRIQAEIAARQQEAERLAARLRDETDRGSRAARLADVLANGPAILAGADPAAANVWLRAHLRVWLKNKEVLIVEWL
ncbi:MAG TPA: recombinase family protein [Caldilinea sp.]|nr:recombinase family protein [Caldilinea sp.]